MQGPCTVCCAAFAAGAGGGGGGVGGKEGWGEGRTAGEGGEDGVEDHAGKALWFVRKGGRSEGGREEGRKGGLGGFTGTGKEGWVQGVMEESGEGGPGSRTIPQGHFPNAPLLCLPDLCARSKARVLLLLASRHGTAVLLRPAYDKVDDY